MAATRFVVTEYSGAGLPLAEFTRDKPGVQVDMIVEPLQAPGSDLQAPGMLLVRGLSPQWLRDLESLLATRYDPARSLRVDRIRGEWFGRFTIHVARMAASPAALAMVHLQDRVGPPWSHVEDGIIYARMRPRQDLDPEAVAQELRAALKARGGEADVYTQEIGARDYSVWDDLVQASVGLRN